MWLCTDSVESARDATECSVVLHYDNKWVLNIKMLTIRPKYDTATQGLRRTRCRHHKIKHDVACAPRLVLEGASPDTITRLRTQRGAGRRATTPSSSSPPRFHPSPPLAAHGRSNRRRAASPPPAPPPPPFDGRVNLGWGKRKYMRQRAGRGRAHGAKAGVIPLLQGVDRGAMGRRLTSPRPAVAAMRSSPWPISGSGITGLSIRARGPQKSRHRAAHADAGRVDARPNVVLPQHGT